MKRNTLLITVILHITGGFSITAGYHRLWSHRSYRAHPVLRYFLAALGAAQCQWSIMWWVQHHRAHHRYTDTDQDPYDARWGFWFSHIGWLLALNTTKWGKVDVSDLKRDPVVIWQQRYYVILAILGCDVLPTAIAYLGWDDWKAGFL
ncbi:uncharacterized protein N7484_000513 [Penicillium longicatenatum]|uniref:uncharacterized protein n=1 Tax=Penicillium longicatenatum TaxID=1561947 RepID=UPI0025483DF9|nr:uncharacterized protein N7484_000513 [Penicillium longicatenatum]KAJ5661141.1 hypothetical protein N7484_000513 [Penicillium longicatenatum]